MSQNVKVPQEIESRWGCLSKVYEGKVLINQTKQTQHIPLRKGSESKMYVDISSTSTSRKRRLPKSKLLL